MADLGEGLEVLHLFTGRPVCAVTLPAPGLHADVNGDGALDHVCVRPRAWLLMVHFECRTQQTTVPVELGRAVCALAVPVPRSVAGKRGGAVLGRKPRAAAGSWPAAIPAGTQWAL